MARPLRIEYPGAFYPMTARGVAQQRILFNDEDRVRFLELLGDVHNRYGFVFHLYCPTGNHYHLEVETPDANLSRGVQWLGQTCASYVNSRRSRAGHLFHGRFKSAVVEKEAYAHVLTRYVQLPRVRARLVEQPSDYEKPRHRKPFP